MFIGINDRIIHSQTYVYKDEKKYNEKKRIDGSCSFGWEVALLLFVLSKAITSVIFIAHLYNSCNVLERLCCMKGLETIL